MMRKYPPPPPQRPLCYLYEGRLIVSRLPPKKRTLSPRAPQFPLFTLSRIPLPFTTPSPHFTLQPRRSLFVFPKSCNPQLKPNAVFSFLSLLPLVVRVQEKFESQQRQQQLLEGSLLFTLIKQILGLFGSLLYYTNP